MVCDGGRREEACVVWDGGRSEEACVMCDVCDGVGMRRHV